MFNCTSSPYWGIELASELKAKVFFLILRRFIACRGKSEKIWSANGSKFNGADRELREALEKLGKRKIYSNCHLKILYRSLILLYVHGNEEHGSLWSNLPRKQWKL